MSVSSLSVLIPTHNDADTIRDVVISAYKYLKKNIRDWEIVILNDASTDTTSRILKELSKTTPHIRVLHHETNQGYGQTIKTLYRAGTKQWLFSLPGDDQIDITVLDTLIPIAEHADIVIGKRLNRQDPLNRKIQSRVYNWLIGDLFDVRITDVNSVRLVNRTAISKLELSSSSAFVDAQMLIEATRANMTLVEVSIVHKSRKTAGASGGNIRKTILPTLADLILFLMK